jgi:hypothetical protein
MDPAPSNEDPTPAAHQAMPQPILHARDGLIAAAGHTRKRSAAVALVAITLGAGVTVYTAMAAGQNCGRDPANKDPNQTAACSHTRTWIGGGGRGFFDNSFAGTHTPGASTSTVTRGGFGTAAIAHFSTGG